jgi:hypothetical protein
MRVGADYHRDDVANDPAKNLTKVGFGGSGRSGIRQREPVARNFSLTRRGKFGSQRQYK